MHSSSLYAASSQSKQLKSVFDSYLIPKVMKEWRFKDESLKDLITTEGTNIIFKLRIYFWVKLRLTLLTLISQIRGNWSCLQLFLRISELRAKNVAGNRKQRRHGQGGGRAVWLKDNIFNPRHSSQSHMITILKFYLLWKSKKWSVLWTWTIGQQNFRLKVK